MKPVPIILLIIFILAIFTVGGGLGIMYENSKKQCNFDYVLESANVLNSNPKVVSPISALGTVSDVSGRYITISNSDQKIKLYVEDDAKIYSVSGAEISPASSADKIEGNKSFSDISVGNFIRAKISFSDDGKLRAESILIMSDFEL